LIAASVDESCEGTAVGNRCLTAMLIEAAGSVGRSKDDNLSAHPAGLMAAAAGPARR
jgi:hypothetical protein